MRNIKKLYKSLIYSGAFLLLLTLLLGANIQAQASQAQDLIAQGKQIFRFDTFGDEEFWGGNLKLHQAIEGAQFGGVGPGLSPAHALAVGLKVDVQALPKSLQNKLRTGQVSLNDPAVTLGLLRLNAIVGMTGFFNPDGTLHSVGIQCALCHSTVDDSFSPGIGNRLDGWANHDLNIGALIALSPDLSPFQTLLGVDRDTAVALLDSWGPGRFDGELIVGGKIFPPQQLAGTNASDIQFAQPTFRVVEVTLHTCKGWGSISYWSTFAAKTEMHAEGYAYDMRFNNAAQFPITANDLKNIRSSVDLITSKLPALQAYELSLLAVPPHSGTLDFVAAARERVFVDDKASCAMCHMPPLLAERNWNQYMLAEASISSFETGRAPELRYRPSPLKGLWANTTGGVYRDARFATLLDVVNTMIRYSHWD